MKMAFKYTSYGFAGKCHTQETIEKIKESMTGKHQSEECKEKRRQSLLGSHRSEETKEKIKKGMIGKNKGKIRSKEFCKNVGIAHLGMKHSEESKRRIGEAKVGKNNPNWNGGTGRLPYSFSFNEELKELIRKRDGYVCQLCGCLELECERRLAVHHIDYIKENLDPRNLLALCCACNIKVNSGRKLWTKFFQSKLKLQKLV